MTLLLEISLDRLVSNTPIVTPDSSGRHNGTDAVRIVSTNYKKMGPDNLLIVASCEGAMAKNYTPKIQFEKGIHFSKVRTPIETNEGDFASGLSSTVDVKVSCDCLDFYWTFAWYNSVAKGLIGKPPSAYSPSGTRPPRNGPKRPGMCKHLLKLVESLKLSNAFTPVQQIEDQSKLIMNKEPIIK